MRVGQHWGFRLFVALIAAVILFAYVPGEGEAAEHGSGSHTHAPLRLSWMTVHLALIAALAPLSFALYRYTPTDLARGPIRTH